MYMDYKKVLKKKRKARSRAKRQREVAKNVATTATTTILVGAMATTAFASTGIVEANSSTVTIFLNEEEKEVNFSNFIEVSEQLKAKQQKALQNELAMQESRRQERCEARQQGIAEEKAKAEAQRQQFEHLLPEEDVLARILQLECGDDFADQICAGSVILNRVRTNYYSFREVHSIAGALYQKGQYESTTKNNLWICKPGENAKKVAHELLTGEILCLEEKHLFQTQTKQDWMYGKLADSNLLGANQYYGYPLDFEEGCSNNF